jgi:hypothetical protein
MIQIRLESEIIVLKAAVLGKQIKRSEYRSEAQG